MLLFDLPPVLTRPEVGLALMFAAATPNAAVGNVSEDLRADLIKLCADKVMQLQDGEGPAAASRFLRQLLKVLASPPSTKR